MDVVPVAQWIPCLVRKPVVQLLQENGLRQAHGSGQSGGERNWWLIKQQAADVNAEFSVKLR
ncbi:hypothetical protein EV672_104153 [Aquabacterium commune]|uniref:Uncharacterized protein n=1 Tax=Aquabacterium commune TaxID=70586 RepID=A0A4R6RCC8_9BURK|nr:hypothetical protein EV672_104153 [Aquabacterium commune]